MVIRTGAKPTPPPARPGLVFNEENHTYKMNVARNSPDYLRVQGVTRIITHTLAKPKLEDYKLKAVARAVRENLPTVLAWHADLNSSTQPDRAQHVFDSKLVQLSNGERDRAANRGKLIHAAAENIGQGQEAPIKKAFVKPVEHFKNWLTENDAEVLLSERPCGNRTLWYAGTFDAVVLFHSGQHAGETWLIDIKTSKGAYGETCLQAIAYADAEFYVDETNTDRPMVPVDKIGVLHLTDARAQLHWLGEMEQAREEYRAVLTLHKTASRRENLIRKQS